MDEAFVLKDQLPNLRVSGADDLEGAPSKIPTGLIVLGPVVLGGKVGGQADPLIGVLLPFGLLAGGSCDGVAAEAGEGSSELDRVDDPAGDGFGEDELGGGMVS